MRKWGFKDGWWHKIQNFDNTWNNIMTPQSQKHLAELEKLGAYNNRCRFKENV